MKALLALVIGALGGTAVADPAINPPDTIDAPNVEVYEAWLAEAVPIDGELCQAVRDMAVFMTADPALNAEFLTAWLTTPFEPMADGTWVIVTPAHVAVVLEQVTACLS